MRSNTLNLRTHRTAPGSPPVGWKYCIFTRESNSIVVISIGKSELHIRTALLFKKLMLSFLNEDSGPESEQNNILLYRVCNTENVTWIETHWNTSYNMFLPWLYHNVVRWRRVVLLCAWATRFGDESRLDEFRDAYVVHAKPTANV